MKTHTIVTYTLDEHPNPENVYDYIRNNWHDLGEFDSQEAIESLKGFCEYFSLSLDYAVSIVSDRGEFITAKIQDSDIAELSYVRLFKWLTNNCKLNELLSGNCPFTGVCYDENLLDQIRAFVKKPDNRTFQDLIDDCTSDLLTALHNQGEYLYSDEGIHEHLSANEYEFTESGEFYQ